ncbi:MAG: DUF3800 domain-containing protein [Bacteroidales bacterium]
MPTYFCFSDECGDYLQKITQKQLKIHPYYLRATIMIDSKEWKKIKNDFIQLKNKYGLPINEEIKWSYIWQLRKYQIEDWFIPEDKPFKFLENFDYQLLFAFIDESLNLINMLDYKKIILTFTDNSSMLSIPPKKIFKFHIQEMMQRIEMALQHNNENLAVIFIDPVSEERNKYFREIYYEIFTNGDKIEEYKHIKDSLNIEYSHHSVGIQIADYICGAFNSILKCNNMGKYEQGIQMFFKSVFPNIRSYKGTMYGYGIREVPRNHLQREMLLKKVESFSKSINNK